MVGKVVKELRVVRAVHLFLTSPQEQVVRLYLLAGEATRACPPVSLKVVYPLPILQK
jgi:hypothetical protein